MRSNSGKHESRTICTAPCECGRKVPSRQQRSPKRRPAAMDATNDRSANSIVIRDAVEREGQDELARPRWPPESRFGLPHPLTRADYAPKNIR